MELLCLLLLGQAVGKVFQLTSNSASNESVSALVITRLHATVCISVELDIRCVVEELGRIGALCAM